MARPIEYDSDTIRDKAMHTFWMRGYDASTVDILGKETGLGKGSFYNAFGSKKALYLKTLDYYAEKELGATIALLAQPGTAQEKIGRWLSNIVDQVAVRKDRRGCLLCNAAVDQAGQDDAVAARVRSHFEPLKQALADIVVVDDDLAGAERHADQLMAVYVGMHVLARGGYSVDVLYNIVTATLAQLPDAA